MKCSKCSTNECMTRHHQYPVCHFGGKREGLKISLCHSCHCKIEMIIASVESYVGDVPFGTRFKLERSCYDRITRHFLKKAKIIYVAVWHYLHPASIYLDAWLAIYHKHLHWCMQTLNDYYSFVIMVNTFTGWHYIGSILLKCF